MLIVLPSPTHEGRVMTTLTKNNDMLEHNEVEMRGRGGMSPGGSDGAGGSDGGGGVGDVGGDGGVGGGSETTAVEVKLHGGFDLKSAQASRVGAALHTLSTPTAPNRLVLTLTLSKPYPLPLILNLTRNRLRFHTKTLNRCGEL